MLPSKTRSGICSGAIPPGEVLRFVPGTRIDDLLGETFCPDDGYCNPHGIATGYFARAKELGIRLKRRTPATGISKCGDRVAAVETPDGFFSCDVVVNAAGAWAGQVGALAGLQIPVAPYRRCVYMTEPFSLIPNEIPLIIDVGSDFYMRKEGQKVLFGLSNLNEPPGENLVVDWEWLDTVMDALISRFPMLQHAGLAPKNCWNCCGLAIALPSPAESGAACCPARQGLVATGKTLANTIWLTTME